jgi:hypothetical protein
MPRGNSIHIGLNAVDPSQYNGWDGQLQACEADALDMRDIANARGFSPTVLLTEEATAQTVTDALSNAAAELDAGDMLLLTYSGHGGQVPDLHGGDEEADAKDETWVLYDRMLIDDELYALWGAFKRGVRILVLSDSCHSGSVVREALDALAANPATRAMVGGEAPRFRDMPRDVEAATYQKHKALYDGIQRAHARGDQVQVEASVILISGCQDNQLSQDGDRNGLFTQRLREVWNEGGFHGGYRRFHREIAGKMPPWQSPNFYWATRRDEQFERKRPFTL